MTTKHGADGWYQPGEGPGRGNDPQARPVPHPDDTSRGDTAGQIDDTRHADDLTRFPAQDQARPQGDEQSWPAQAQPQWHDQAHQQWPDHPQWPDHQQWQGPQTTQQSWPDHGQQSWPDHGQQPWGDQGQAYGQQAYEPQWQGDQGWAPGQQNPAQPHVIPQQAAMPASASQLSASTHGSAAYPMSQTSAPWVNQPSAGYPLSQTSAPYPMSQSSAGFPVSQVSAGYPVSQASAYEQGRPAEREKSFPLKWLAAGAIVLALLTGTALFGISEFNKSRTNVAVAAPTTLTQRQAPPSWSQTYDWSILADQASSVVVGDNRVVFIDGKGALNVLDADTGKPVFTSSSPRLSGGARTMLATVQGTPMIAVADGTNLYLWPMQGTQGAQPKQITLPTNGKTFSQGGGLMVLAGKEQWAVTGAATLAPVSIPGDHIALGVAPDGFLVSAPQRGGWTFRPSDPGQAPREVKPERTPEGTTGEMQAGRLSRGVIAAWGDTADPARKTIGLYDAPSGRLLAGATVAADLIKDVTLTVSPGGTLASAGPVLARLTDGRTELMERWSAHMSDSKHLYGSRDGVKYAWGGEGAPQQLDPRVTLPWGTSLEKGLSIVMEPADNGQFVLGGLRPN
ncbi:hypothetical protein [Mariniluteicoccus flavus]